jgi:hypothetical protein
MSSPSKGFVIVASKQWAFYASAVNLIDSILDHYEDARITLFTHDDWVDDRARNMCEHIFDCPDHIRSKMYGMQNTPYDITFYIDADCECAHEDIITVWDELGDNDLTFVELKKDARSQGSFAEVYAEFGDGERVDLTLCGGVCLYDHSKPIMKEFMIDWWEMFVIQERIYQKRKKDIHYDEPERWWANDVQHSMLRWDQFTLWWMVNKMDKYKDIKIGRFSDNYRWNWFTSFRQKEDGSYNLVDKDPIIIHYSSTMNKAADYRI